MITMTTAGMMKKLTWDSSSFSVPLRNKESLASS